jgi:hypothetical protein
MCSNFKVHYFYYRFGVSVNPVFHASNRLQLFAFMLLYFDYMELFMFDFGIESFPQNAY